MAEDIITENKTSKNYELDKIAYIEIPSKPDNESNYLYLTLFYYNNNNNLETLIKEISGQKATPLSNVELGSYVLGIANTNQGFICYKDTIGGKDLDEILYHELLYILYPEKDEAWVREQTLKAGYSRFQYPIANYN